MCMNSTKLVDIERFLKIDIGRFQKIYIENF